jgi:tetratricopeptide (TPR) repeat protein
MLAVLIGLAPHTAGATEGAETPMQAARTLMQEQKYDEAVEAFGAIVAAEPDNARAWYLLGFSNHARQAYAEAITAYERALELGAVPPTTMYNLACAHARLGEVDEALGYLDRAADAGFSALPTLDGDADLAAVRDDARFAAIREKVEALANPCDDEEFHRFDFWIGEWNVLQNGQVVGTNRIERISEGCALFESWEDASGVAGHSINFYDPHADRWKQTWVGGSGGILEFVEVDDADYDDGAMRFVATSHDRQGRASLQRMTFYDQADGSVRQLIEQSTDGGATWSPSFDGRYERKDSAATTP